MSTVWLIGAGRMAIAYAKVLKALGRDVQAIGRSEAGAAAFTAETGAPCRAGGLPADLAEIGGPARDAIVAVNVDQLSATSRRLIDGGVRRLLIEKPAGVDPAEIEELAAAAAARGVEAYVAYNRRFYASVDATRQAIEEDGGVTSVTFEFTELSDVIARSPNPPAVKANWLYANSTHVIDLAFFIGGSPISLAAEIDGALDWHPAAARFAGAGRTDRNALFSYMAEWDGPGRWSVEAATRHRRLILRPMEQLQVQKRGAFSIDPVEIDDTLDRSFKPGLYAQTKAFLDAAFDPRLLTLGDHLRRVREIYTPIYRGARIDAPDRPGRTA